jgi:hypothetical protein
MENLLPNLAFYFLYILIFLVVHYTILVFYLRMVARLLVAVQPENRRLSPGIVWIGLIPFFHLVWPLILNPLVCRSVRAELESRKKDEYGNYGMAPGILFPLMILAGSFIPWIGRFITAGGFLIWFLFWMRLNDYKRRIEEGQLKQEGDLLDD